MTMNWVSRTFGVIQYQSDINIWKLNKADVRCQTKSMKFVSAIFHFQILTSDSLAVTPKTLWNSFSSCFVHKTKSRTFGRHLVSTILNFHILLLPFLIRSIVLPDLSKLCPWIGEKKILLNTILCNSLFRTICSYFFKLFRLLSWNESCRQFAQKFFSVFILAKPF